RGEQERQAELRGVGRLGLELAGTRLANERDFRLRHDAFERYDVRCFQSAVRQRSDAVDECVREVTARVGLDRDLRGLPSRAETRGERVDVSVVALAVGAKQSV